MHHVTAALLQTTVVSYYKLRQVYYKLQQNIITNYGSLLQITTVRYYKLRCFYYKLRQNVITNYGSFIKLLQITAAFRVITNYRQHIITNYSRYYNLRCYYKLRRNNEYMDDWKKFNETSLPGKDEFHSNLNMEDITDADYMHVKRVCKDVEKSFKIEKSR